MRQKHRYQRSLTSISDIINNFTRKRYKNILRKSSLEHQLSQNWDSLVGLYISPYTMPRGLYNGKLYVNTINSVWVQELTFMEEKIKVQINNFFKKKIINKIYFNIGVVEKTKDSLLGSLDLDRVELSHEEVSKINDSTKDLKDEEMKNILNNFFAKSLKRSKLEDEINN